MLRPCLSLLKTALTAGSRHTQLCPHLSAARTMASSSIAERSAFNEDTLKFLDDLYQLIRQDEFIKGTDPKEKVVDFQHPHDLQGILNLDIGKTGASHQELLEECRKVIKYSVKTAHPHFYNQFYMGRDPYSLGAAFMVESLNTNQHTFEVAPVFVLAEICVVKKLCELIGYENGDGVFGPGGSVSNMIAVHLARYKYDKNLKKTGLFGQKRMRLFCAELAHYSAWKGVHFMGFGTDSVVAVKTDELGIICTKDLQEKVMQCKQEGDIPLAVVATSGSTVLGSFDPIDRLADVCKEHGMWLHVDAAWGGGVLFSKEHRHLMKGIERADSVLWNAHKMVQAQIQLSALLVKEKGLLEECNGIKATYLFQQDKFYDVSFDVLGDKTLQCGRKADAFKLWLQWKAHGDDGMGAIVDKAYANAKYFTERLQAHPGFKLVMPAFQCTNLCFWYIPPSLRNQPESEEWWKKVDKVAPKIKERMVKKGSLMIGYNPIKEKGWVNFFRIIIRNPITDDAELDYVISELEELGKDL